MADAQREDSMILSDNSINLIYSPSESVEISDDQSMSDDETQQNRNKFSSVAPKEQFFKNLTLATNVEQTASFCARNRRKIKRSAKTVFWFVLFAICEFAIVLYFGTLSIPNENTLSIDFDGWTYTVLRCSVWLVIAVSNAFIVPRVSKTMCRVCCEWIFLRFADN